MSSNRREPTDDELVGMDLPSVRSGGRSLSGHYASASPAVPRGRAGRKAEAETSLVAYRIEKDREKADLIQRGATQVTASGFRLLVGCEYAMLSDLLEHKHPKEVEIHLKQEFVDMLGDLGDYFKATREAYVQKVLRELR